MRRLLLGILLTIVIGFSYVGYSDLDTNPAPEETSNDESSEQQF
ncbi:hypothetical protein GCM10010954_24190 [Halobacillus andaensis]|uniref:Uncharacterized protein n=1 Tax=Halobacillus andaensis TaxID=1176239 RepID=A0A917B5X8_HALAA|nr:hypothetical protein [Halobacillus andaensis]MBP2005992.1 hypothetical protein [Halobacillus andaensis]GGF24459.1 hypothetical protein GCM10010954_24190 [Halobacillus andaensis]